MDEWRDKPWYAKLAVALLAVLWFAFCIWWNVATMGQP